MSNIENIDRNWFSGREVDTGFHVVFYLSNDWLSVVRPGRDNSFKDNADELFFWASFTEVSIFRIETELGERGLIQIRYEYPIKSPPKALKIEMENFETATQMKTIMDQRIAWSIKKYDEKLYQTQEEQRKRLELERLRKSKHASGDFSDVTPMQFERIIEELFTIMGYSVTHVGGSGDQGIDLVCNSTRTNERVVIQCKRYKKEIGAPILRDFYGAFIHSGANAGCIITTSFFTKQAIQWAQGKPIKLIDKIKLQNLLIKYYMLE